MYVDDSSLELFVMLFQSCRSYKYGCSYKKSLVFVTTVHMTTVHMYSAQLTKYAISQEIPPEKKAKKHIFPREFCDGPVQVGVSC
jgi:hypothetical protein